MRRLLAQHARNCQCIARLLDEIILYHKDPSCVNDGSWLIFPFILDFHREWGDP